jgi:hypothetical protein
MLFSFSIPPLPPFEVGLVGRISPLFGFRCGFGTTGSCCCAVHLKPYFLGMWRNSAMHWTRKTRLPVDWRIGVFPSCLGRYSRIHPQATDEYLSHDVMLKQQLSSIRFKNTHWNPALVSIVACPDPLHGLSGGFLSYLGIWVVADLVEKIGPV